MAATPLHINSSIQFLAGTLLNTAKAIKAIKDASTEINEFADDVDILSGVLLEFQEAVETTIPTITEANKRQNAYRTARKFITKIRKITNKMINHSDLLFTAAKSTSRLQRFLAKIKWVRDKSSIAAARQTIFYLSSNAGVFLTSVLCKSLYDKIAELQKTRAKVPEKLVLTL